MDWLKYSTDKFIIVLILCLFGWSAVHGAQYSQHVVDWALGALGVLIIQRAQKDMGGPTNPPQNPQ